MLVVIKLSYKTEDDYYLPEPAATHLYSLHHLGDLSELVCGAFLRFLGGVHQHSHSSGGLDRPLR